MKHIKTFNNFLNEDKNEVWKGLKLGTKYSDLRKIEDLGFVTTQDDDGKEGDLLWSSYDGRLYRLPCDLDARDIKMRGYLIREK